MNYASSTVGFIITMCTVWILLTVMFRYAHAANTDICLQTICEYHFNVYRVQTMAFSTHNETFNVHEKNGSLEIKDTGYWDMNPGAKGRRVSAEDVVTADGVQRSVITINGQFPGPTLEVMQGAQIVVHVHNQLHSDVLTLHWHGLHAENNTWMDGVPYVTQCPVLPRQTFTYRVMATSVGTHWYHSHVVGQRLDGLFGVLLVHENLPSIPYSVVTVMDWNHRDFNHWYVTNPYDADRPGNGELHVNDRRRLYSVDSVELSVLRYQSGLINGRGRYNKNSSLSLTKFTVQRAQRHRFHVVNTGAEYTFEVSIDNHMLVIVASDGAKINPMTVDFLHIFPGERYEFDVLPNKKESAYWFRAQTLSHGIGMYPKDDGITHEINAIMEYQTSSTSNPTSKKKKCSLTNQCTVFNCPFEKYHFKHHRKCIGISKSQAKETDKNYRKQFGLDDEDVEEIFLNFAFSYGSSINARRFIEPKEPFHQNRTGGTVACPEYCDDKGCRCTHTLHIPHNKTIQMVLTGLMPGFPFIAHHAVHLHGYSFAVLKMGYGELNETTGFWRGNNRDITCNNHLCSKPSWYRTPELNLKNPPVKDTVVVPARGYTVIRFRANNPGYWRLHCHQELHLLEGMDMLVIEGEELIQPPPPHFPTCHQFHWTNQEFMRYSHAQQSTPGLSLGVMLVTGCSVILLVMLLLCCGYQLSSNCAAQNQAVMWQRESIRYSQVDTGQSAAITFAAADHRIVKRKRLKTM